MTNMMKILIADDHDIVIEGLKSVIAGSVNMTVADVAFDGEEALSKIRDNDFDMLILDLSMPGRGGLDIIKDVKRIRPRLPVVILSMYPEDQYALRAMRSGASGYLTKGISSRELIDALQKVALGKRYVSSTMAELLAGSLKSDADALPHERLSDREFQIMLLISAGEAPKVISEKLALGKKTVNNYRASILEKMGMKCNTDLARYTMQHNLM